MNFRDEYSKKLTTAADAAKLVKSGDYIDYGFCVNHTRAFDEELAKRLKYE